MLFVCVCEIVDWNAVELYVGLPNKCVYYFVGNCVGLNVDKIA